MAAKCLDLCDAVVTELNDPARSWAGQFEAKREYAPDLDAIGLGDLTVYVAPATADSERTTRDLFTEEDVIQMAILQRLRPRTKEACDALVGLAMDIRDYFRDHHALTGFTNSEVTKSMAIPVYDPEQLRQGSLFVSVIELTVEETS